MRKEKILCLVLSSTLLVGCGKKNKDDEIPPRVFEYQQLDKNAVRDKILGGWIGHCIGMGSGFEYVVATDNISEKENAPVDGYLVNGKTAVVALADKYWEPDGQIGAGSIGTNPYRIHPISDPRLVKGKVYSDDDCHVDVLNQFIFREYGPLLGNNDIASAWDYYDVHDVGGGEPASSLIQNNNYVSPYSGQMTYGNVGYWVTESWIENETLGMLFPYMYGLAEGYADMFTQVQGDGLGYYLGKLCALMYSLAYEYNDAKVIMEKAFEMMPKSNQIYDMYLHVKKCYNSKVSWRKACTSAVEKSTNYAKVKIADLAGFSIDANAAMIFIGLFYGENDFEESTKITSLCGLDGDCTAATVGGLVGMINGFNNLDQKYKDYLNGDSIYYNYTGENSGDVGVSWGPFAYMGANFPNSFTFDYLTDLTLSNLENIVEYYNGSIAEDKITVAKQAINKENGALISNYSFENGNTDGWAIEGEATLSASTAATHLGTYGGLIVLDDETKTAKVYHEVDLRKGDKYKLTLWVNGGTDRQFRLFASDGSNTSFKTYTNPVSLSNRHMKAELMFTATSNKMKVGIEYVNSGEDVYSTTLGIDDMGIENYTDTVVLRDKVVSLEGENFKDARKTKNKKYSGDNAANLLVDTAISTTYTGKEEVQSFKFYYDLQSDMLASLSIVIDGRKICDLPLVATGINNQKNESNYAEIQIFVGKGEHTLELQNNSFFDIVIDKVTISSASALLNK